MREEERVNNNEPFTESEERESQRKGEKVLVWL